MKQFFQKQDGASTLLMVIIAAVTMTTAGTTVTMLDQRKSYLEIVRIKSQIDLTEARLQASASSLAGLRASAARGSQNSSLSDCLAGRSCRDMGDNYRPYLVYVN